MVIISPEVLLQICASFITALSCIKGGIFYFFALVYIVLKTFFCCHAFFALRFIYVHSIEEDLACLDAQIFLSFNGVTHSSEIPCLFMTENNCELTLIIPS